MIQRGAHFEYFFSKLPYSFPVSSLCSSTTSFVMKWLHFSCVFQRKDWNDQRDRPKVPWKMFKGIEVAPSLLKFHLLHKNLSDYPTEDAFPVLWNSKTLGIYCIFWFLAYILRHLFLVALGLEPHLPTQRFIFACLWMIVPRSQGCWAPRMLDTGTQLILVHLISENCLIIVFKTTSFS